MDGSAFIIVGRVLLGGLFVIGGVRHFGELGPLTEACRVRRVPLPRFSLLAASLFQIIAGALLMVGLFVSWAALGLILFTLVASAVMVDFWNQEGERRAGSINVWLSNLALIGGLLIAAASAEPTHAASPNCAVPAVELNGTDKTFASKFRESTQQRKAVEANVIAAFRSACSKRLLSGSTIPKLSGVPTNQLFLENWPDANVASLEADQLTGRKGWRLILGYPFVASDGSVNVPTADEIEEAIYCAVRGATEQEQAESGRCLPD